MARGFVICLGSILIMMAIAATPVREDGHAADVASVPEVDCVSLVTNHYSSYGEVAGSFGFQLFSNGSAFNWYAVYDLSDDNLAADYNESYWSESGSFDMILSAMYAEGFWTMGELYVDARSAAPYLEKIMLCAAGPSSNKSVAFEGEAIVGLMPETYRLVNMAGWEDVSVEVSVEETSPLMFEVSCVLDNGCETDISVVGVVEDFWHIIVVRDNGCTFKPMDTVLTPSIKTVAPGEEVVFEPKTLNASEYPDGDYVVLVPVSPFTGIAKFTVHGNDAYVNTPPFDRGNMVSVDDRESGAITIELLRCCDVEDRADDILVRWDWESDGTWDTGWSPDKTVTHTFGDPDHLNVTYELADTDGDVTVGGVWMTIERSEEVVFGVSLPGLIAVAAVVVVATVALALVVRKASRKSGPGK